MAVNTSKTKTPMPEQDPLVRNRNFYEVSTGYTEEMALEEAARCLNCKHKPCIHGCPVNVKIPEFIQLVSERRYEDASRSPSAVWSALSQTGIVSMSRTALRLFLQAHTKSRSSVPVRPA